MCIQVVLQDDGCGRRIEVGLALAPIALVHRQTAFGFITRQALILVHDGDPGAYVQWLLEREDSSGRFRR